MQKSTLGHKAEHKTGVDKVHLAQMPNVAFLVSHTSPGGAQEIWMDLAEGFKRRKYDVRLIALYPSTNSPPLTSDTIPWQYLIAQRPNTPKKLLQLAMALFSFYKSDAPAYLFTAMPAANVLAPLMAYLSGAKVKVIISHHSPVNTHNRLLNFLDGWVGSLKQTHRIVSVSKSVSQTLDNKAPSYRAKGQVIYNALPPKVENRLIELMSGKRRLTGGGRRVVAIGRLSEEKNYPTLLHAAARMPDVKIDIVGTGPEEANLKALAFRLGVENNVHFHGQLPRRLALKILTDADIFVQPSFFEGHSLALIEAAKAHLPLVVSDVPAQIEGITTTGGIRCGIAVEVTNDEALAKEILNLLNNDDDYLLWSRRSRELGEEVTFEHMVASYENLAR